MQAGADSNHACLKKIPESYQKTVGFSGSATGLSTGAVVGIGAGAAALIGGGIALAASGGGSGGGGSDNGHNDACADVVCEGANQHCANGQCVCNTGFTMFDGICYETLSCVNGTQAANTCVCRPGYTGSLCDTCDNGYINQGGVCYAQLTCGTNQHQEAEACVCDAGFGFFGTSECHAALACKDGSQHGNACVCNGHAAGELCDSCESGYGFHGTTQCHADLACVNGTQTGNACVCATEGWTGTLCDTPAPCTGYEHSTCPTGYAPSATCLSGDTSLFQCNHCAEGYGKYGTNECRATISCGTNQHQQADTCVCDTGYEMVGGVCTFTSCPANHYEYSGLSVCLECPNNSTSPAGSTSIDQCVCNSGYKKTSTGLCSEIQQNVSGNGYVYKFERDTGFQVYNNDEDITVQKSDMGEGIFTMWEDGGTVINNAKIEITGTESIYGDPLIRSDAKGTIINNGILRTPYSALQVAGANTIINNGTILKKNSTYGYMYNLVELGVSDGTLQFINNGEIEHEYTGNEVYSSLISASWGENGNMYIENNERLASYNGASIKLGNGHATGSLEIVNSGFIDGVIRGDAVLAEKLTITNKELMGGIIIYAADEDLDETTLTDWNITNETDAAISNTIAGIFIQTAANKITPTIINNGYIGLTRGVGIHTDAANIYNSGEIEIWDSNWDSYGFSLSPYGLCLRHTGICGVEGSINNLENGIISMNEGYGIKAAQSSVQNAGKIELTRGIGIEAYLGNVLNSGLITINDPNFFEKYEDVIGEERERRITSVGINYSNTDSNSVLRNTGNINISLAGSTTSNSVTNLATGISVEGGVVYNEGSIIIEDKTSESNGEYYAPYIIGINATEGSVVYNTGKIQITSEQASGTNIHGIYASNSKVENDGDIIINVNNATDLLKPNGIYATGKNATVYNAGTITINDSSYDGNEANGHFIVLVNGATMATSGTLSSANALNLNSFSADGTGRVSLLSEGNLKAETITGDLYIDSSTVASGFATTYTNANAIQANDTAHLNLVSDSVLFHAALAENGNDIVMTMKSFDDVTSNPSLAAFLEKNYAGQKNEAFFNELKSMTTASNFASALTDLTASSAFTQFMHEDLTAFREVNTHMNALMFSNMDKPVFENAGTFNAFSFQNNSHSSAQFALAHKRISPYTKIGYAMSTTHLNSDDQRDTTRRNDIFQAFTPIGYDRFGWQLITTPQIGFARGHYTRKGYNGSSYNGVVEKRFAAMMNEARYPLQVAGMTFAPTIELNALFYNQKGNESKKAYSLTMPSNNMMSVEAGAGFHLDTRIKELSLTAGVMLYHEFADPYHIKVGMNGMDGSFDLSTDQKKYRGVVDFGFGYDAGLFNLYGSCRHFMETQNRTQFNAGFRIPF